MRSLSGIYGEHYFRQVRTVTNRSEFPSRPRSDVIYFIDGRIDMKNKQITVPSGGLFYMGHNLDLSLLYSTEDDYTMFVGDNAGSVFASNISVSTSGENSSIYALTGATGNEVIEVDHFNYLDCSSRGYIDNFRQGLETVVGIYGGKPELELRGAWSGFRSSVTNCFGLDSDFDGYLFKEGSGLTFSSRFVTDINCSLPTSAGFADFSPSNFTAPSLLQIRGAIMARNGVISSGDNVFFPNLDPEDIACSWKENQGLRNTFEGGRLTLEVESVTTIGSSGTFYDFDGTWGTEDLQHFSSPSNGRLRNDGTNPIEFSVIASLTIEGQANDAISVRIQKWDDSEGQFVTAFTQNGTINSLSGPRDVAFVSINYNMNIEQNDYIFLEVANLSSPNDFTLEQGSFIQVNAR